MKMNISAIIDSKVLKALIDHFNYSIKDINSYDELTDEEKKIIDRNLFRNITSISTSSHPKSIEDSPEDWSLADEEMQ